MESASGAKRPRPSSFGDENGPAPMPSSTPLAPSATSHTTPGTALVHTSSLGASQRACSVISHSRLETLVKQLELLRQLDSEAHEAVKAELQEQIIKLKAQVEALTAALQGATASLSSLQKAASPQVPAKPSAASNSSETAALKTTNEALHREIHQLRERIVDQVRPGKRI